MSRSNFVTVSGGVPGRYEPPPPAQDYDDGVHYVFEQGDPLARFPRVLTPHLFMPEIRAVALDPRLFDTVEELLAEQALLSFTMFYFKPPGARGQAFRQDNFYLKVQPGTCCAVWIACDRAGWQRCDSLGDGCADVAGAGSSTYALGAVDSVRRSA